MKPVAAAFGDDGGNSGDVALSSCCHSISGLLLLLRVQALVKHFGLLLRVLLRLLNHHLCLCCAQP
jgi:hypothetical protein